MGETEKLVRCTACGTLRPWSEYQSIGHMPDGDGGTLDLRNCPGCGGTIAELAEPSIETRLTNNALSAIYGALGG